MLLYLYEYMIIFIWIKMIILQYDIFCKKKQKQYDIQILKLNKDIFSF